MPNQYNAYQQSAYGQHFMNKGNGYTGMYGQQPPQQQQPMKPAVSNAYTGGSPYGNPSPLYSNQSYDDLVDSLNSKDF
jgi:hypothetical protein